MANIFGFKSNMIKRDLAQLFTTKKPELASDSRVREFVLNDIVTVSPTEFPSTVRFLASTMSDLFKNLHFVNATSLIVDDNLDPLDAFNIQKPIYNGFDAIVSSGEGLPLGIPMSILVGILLFILFLFCVVGNLFVIFAVLMERDLRSRPQYYLIFSLAIADLLVGMVVIPLGAWATINQAWHLGVTLCDFWISVDVLVCTSSILHLVAIALDRYWSITDIYYVQNRTPKRIFLMLLLIWVVSLLISLAPIFGWKDAQFVSRVREQHVCLISQQISYQVFSTATAFYIPLCAIIVVYYKIMRAAKKRFRRERDRRTINKNGASSRAIEDDATIALTSACATIGGGDAADAMDAADASTGCGGRQKVATHKKSVPSLLSSHEVLSFENSPTFTCENGYFKAHFESTTIVNHSTPEEKDRFRTVVLPSDPSKNKKSFCCFGKNDRPRIKNNENPSYNTSNKHEFGNYTEKYDTITKVKANGNPMGQIRNANSELNNMRINDHANNNTNNDRTGVNNFASSTTLLATLETQFVKSKKNSRAKSLFLKRAGAGALGATAARVKRKKGARSMKETAESRRERKAWRTLAIITGTFVACWTPFFLVSLYRPICACRIPPVVESVTAWLGYLNSALNPVIYTVFSMDFRMAFQRILKRMCLIKEF